MDNIPQIGSIWRHKKGGLYQVTGIGTHTETLEPYVIYHALGDHDIIIDWLRPLKMFMDGRFTLEEFHAN